MFVLLAEVSEQLVQLARQRQMELIVLHVLLINFAHQECQKLGVRSVTHPLVVLVLASHLHQVKL